MSSSENQPENTTEQPQNDSFKAQLDRVAFDRRNTPQESQGNPVVEKITEYIPAAAKVLGGSKQTQQEDNAPQRDVPGPPERPDHDHKIEDFVRDQHRSVTDEGVLNTGKSGEV